MKLPEDLREKIDQILEKTPPSVLAKAREELSKSYRNVNSSESIFSNIARKFAYLATRFPATYAAVHFVLGKLLDQIPNFPCDRILDLGAGPGTASFAAIDWMTNIHKITLIEKSSDAIQLGKQLCSGLSVPTEWICQDLKQINSFPEANLAILSYSLGETKPFDILLDRLWKSEIDTIAMIEPGTPAGYQTILQARAFFLKHKAHIIAPCPHIKPCPIQAPDWCHFSVRLERTKLHRLLKEGSLGFEDEKFSYLIVSKSLPSPINKNRILRHPMKGSGHVRLTLCTDNGLFEERTISRKDKDLYRQSRDAEWGDLWSGQASK